MLTLKGIYTGNGNRDIEFSGKTIEVRSESGPEETIIDCDGSVENPHRGFLFQSQEKSGAILSGFTIRNGYARDMFPYDCGGGIFCEAASSPTITDCILAGNHAEYCGGGISIGWSSPVIRNTNVTGNSAAAGPDPAT